MKLNNNNNVKQELMLILFNNLYSGNFKIISFRKTTDTQRRNQISLYKVTEVSLHVLFLKIHFKMSFAMFCSISQDEIILLNFI